MMRRILAIVGATATGKTALGEAVAAALGAEIVCADARQVFRELELGTGKPTPKERGAQPHHLFDSLSLGDQPSAGWYAHEARDCCEKLFAQGRTPILVGGSGLYLQALQRGLHAEPPRDVAVRARLQEMLQADGPQVLHARLASADPATASRLSPSDSQRITRALEVYESSGRAMSWWHAQEREGALTGQWRVVEVTVGPRLLAERIAARTRTMFTAGLLEETRALVNEGRRASLESLQAIGYDESLGLLDGRLDRAAAEELVCLRTRQLAKRQRTWFRHQMDALRLETDDGDVARLMNVTLEHFKA